jgi:hypothetical protein
LCYFKLNVWLNLPGTGAVKTPLRLS